MWGKVLFCFMIAIFLPGCRTVNKAKEVDTSNFRAIEVNSRRISLDSLASSLKGVLQFETIRFNESMDTVEVTSGTLKINHEAVSVVKHADTIQVEAVSILKHSEAEEIEKQPPDIFKKIVLIGFAILLIIIIFALYKHQKKLQYE